MPTAIDLRQKKFSALIDLVVGSQQEVFVPKGEVTIVHLGMKPDFITQSAGTDYIVVGAKDDENYDADGTAGINKIPIFAGGNAKLIGGDIPIDDNGSHCLVLDALGDDAKVLIVIGNFSFK